MRLVRPDGSFDHAAKRSFPTLLGALTEFSGVARSGPLAQYRATTLADDAVGDVDAVNGAFMLIRREAIDAVGLLDEGYGMYGEDLDWCRRFKAAGWRVVYDGGATVLHVKGALSVVSHGRARHRGLRTNLAFHRAMGRYYRKFHGGPHPLLDLLVYLALGAKLAVSVARSTVARRAADLRAPASCSSRRSWSTSTGASCCSNASRRCRSRSPQVDGPTEIVVVDNGSADDSVAHVRERFEAVRIVALERNIGFAGGVNVGLAASSGEWLLLLNNDATIEPGGGARAAGARPRVGPASARSPPRCASPAPAR